MLSGEKMPIYNFLKQASVKLVTGVSSATAAAYPHSGLVNYFRLNNLTTGLVDVVSSKTAVNGSMVVDTDTNCPFTNSLKLTAVAQAGLGLLSATDANSVEADKTWSFSLWFRSDSTSGSNQSRLVTRDFSDGWGVKLNQLSTSSGLLDVTLQGELDTIPNAGAHGPTAANLGSITTGSWNNIVITAAPKTLTITSAGGGYSVGDEVAVTGLTGYLNGVKHSNFVTYKPTIPSGLIIGSNANSGSDSPTANQGFIGALANAQVWNRTLTDAEALAIYDSNKTGTAQYSLEVGPELSFSQTFTEDKHSVDTIHEEKFFEAGTITKANPANFGFKLPVISEADFEIVRTKLLDCTAFDLYVSTQQDVFKLENSVLTNGTFDIERSKPLSLSVTGEASKLTKIGVSSSYLFPGAIVADSATRTHLISEEHTITLGGSDISDSIYSIKAELQNDIAWTPYQTVNAGLAATNAATAMFPDSFTIKGKTLSGSIGRYLADTTGSDAQTFSTGTSLRIQAGKDLHVSNAYPGIDINMTSCSFTNRATVSDVFTQSYDWRFSDNPTNLLDVIKT
tara:strand:+ start:3791 stop:5488 length:1698 start_codon:yes stop_codon:yes gene_type:complete